MVLKTIHFSLVALLLMAVTGCSRRSTPSEARLIGEKALKEYCVQEGLDRSDFGAENILPEEKYDWSIEYQSHGNPKHVLILYIKNNKIVERHRMIE